MDRLYHILLLLFLLAGLASILFGLPGIWIMVVAAALHALITGAAYISWWTILALVGLGVVAEILEFALGVAGAKKAGGGARSAWGALIGGFLGALFLSFIPIPIISTIAGACMGAFMGAFAGQYWARRDAGHSLRVGYEAAKGRLWGTIAKLVFGVIVFAIALWAVTFRNDSQPPPAPTTMPAHAPGSLPSAVD